MQIEIPDNLFERVGKVLDKGVELGLWDKVPTEDEIVALIEKEVEALEGELDI